MFYTDGWLSSVVCVVCPCCVVAGQSDQQWSAGVPTRDWRQGDCPQSVLTNPPLAIAVEWNVRNREERSEDVAVQNAIQHSTIAQDCLMDQTRSGAVPLDTDDDPVLRACHLEG